MHLLKALTLSLGDTGNPVVTNYQLGLILFKLYKDKKYKGTKLNLQKDVAELTNYYKYRSQLIDNGILTERSDLPNNVLSILGNNRFEAEEIACLTDPFCYISYLSAMSYHGLTDRIPSKVFLCTLENKTWKNNAYTKMQKDLKDDFDVYWRTGLPNLNKIEIKRIGKMEFTTINLSNVTGYINAHGKNFRVSSIGKTFLDCIRKPSLCGGINHVIQTYEDYAEKYLRLIIEEFESHGNAIDKVRAGYIIEERMGIKNSIIEEWARFAQRGGSRKLDSGQEYVPNWSDKWCISINIFEKQI